VFSRPRWAVGGKSFRSSRLMCIGTALQEYNVGSTSQFQGRVLATYRTPGKRGNNSNAVDVSRILQVWCLDIDALNVLLSK